MHLGEFCHSSGSDTVPNDFAHDLARYPAVSKLLRKSDNSRTLRNLFLVNCRYLTHIIEDVSDMHKYLRMIRQA